MEEIKVNGEAIKLKKNYLSIADSEAIILYATDNFNKQGVIKSLNYDYLSLENSFFDALCIICIDGFDDDMRESIYNAGLRDELLNGIINARNTYDKMYFIAKEITSVGNIATNFVAQMLDTIPNSDAIESFAKNIPDLQNAIQQYNNIIGNNQEGE